MSYLIVVDSCCELPDELYNDPRFVRIPLELSIGDYRIKDDDSFDQADFLERVARSSECARSACPTPEDFMDAYAGIRSSFNGGSRSDDDPAGSQKKDETPITPDPDLSDIYVVTLSSKLSGSYNAALLASQLYEEEYEDEYGPRNIHVIDSKSAAAGETQIALKLMEYAEAGMTFDEICTKIDSFRDSVKTYFVIDNLDTFIKNGRLKGLKAAVATTLSIKPILTGVDGEIQQIGQAIGMKKALMQMMNIIHSRHLNNESRQIIITHCNCYDRAKWVADSLSDITDAPVMIHNARGVSTTYANDGGVVVTI